MRKSVKNKLTRLCLTTTALLSLSGCFYQTVDYLDVAAATDYCQDKGGISYILETFDGMTKVSCFEEKSQVDIDKLVVELEVKCNKE